MDRSSKTGAGEAVYSRARAYAWRVTRTYSGRLRLGAGAIKPKVTIPGVPKAGAKLDLSNTELYNASAIADVAGWLNVILRSASRVR